jgi:hypothetical protein
LKGTSARTNISMVGASDFFKWAGTRRDLKGTGARTDITIVGASDFFKWAGARRDLKGTGASDFLKCNTTRRDLKGTRASTDSTIVGAGEITVNKRDFFTRDWKGTGAATGDLKGAARVYVRATRGYVRAISTLETALGNLTAITVGSDAPFGRKGRQLVRSHGEPSNISELCEMTCRLTSRRQKNTGGH